MSHMLLLALAGFLLFAVVVAVAGVLVVLLLRSGPRSYGTAHRPTFSTPLERTQAAASELTPAEWEQFRHWVEGRRPLPSSAGEEGITR